MTVLSIDTVCDSVSCAVAREQTVLGEIFLHIGLKHSVTLMESVHSVLDLAGVKKDELDAIAVLSGPGSFTGIRIGISTASALAYALSIPIFSVSTLDALVAGGGSADAVCAILDARRGEVYVKAVDGDTVLIAPTAMPLVEVIEVMKPTVRPLFMGDAAVKYRQEIVQALPGARFLPEGLSYPHAQYAFAAIARGLADECTHATLRASYLRPSQAERLREECR